MTVPGSGQQPSPTWPRGGPPQGGGWPVTPPGPPPVGPPPGWGPPGYYGGPPGPPPGRRGPRWGLIVACALALVLVTGLAITGWAYATGRFGIGPLSAKDEAAVTAIAHGVEAPEWAGEDERECAADQLVRDSRSPDLERRGLIEADGDGWTYTGKWQHDDATAFVESVLDCSDDWPAVVGESWNLEDTDCLGDLDSSTVAEYFVAEGFALSDGEDGAQEGRDQAVAGLDECYVSDPPAPSAKARSAYRAVNFRFKEPESDYGDVILLARDSGDWAPVDGGAHQVDTVAGGRKGCVEARVEASYPWGTSRTSEKRFCGRSKPARIWWVRAKRCSYTAGCTKWDLRYEGLASFDSATVRLLENGGDCNSESGRCARTFIGSANGRGTAISWSVYPGYDEHFVGRIGRLEAVLPD
jgi:hypothetical protein